MIQDRLHITSGATINWAEHTSDGALNLSLSDFADETSYTLIASPKRATRITLSNAALSESDDVEEVENGWQWLPTHNAALIKMRSGQNETQLHIQFEG